MSTTKHFGVALQIKILAVIECKKNGNSAVTTIGRPLKVSVPLEMSRKAHKLHNFEHATAYERVRELTNDWYHSIVTYIDSHCKQNLQYLEITLPNIIKNEEMQIKSNEREWYIENYFDSVCIILLFYDPITVSNGVNTDLY